jgi:hypothetical protein
VQTHYFEFVPNFCSENGSSLAHHLRFLDMRKNQVQPLKTNDFQCAVRIQFLYISRNPLREIQNNVLASLKGLRNLTIHPSGHILKHIQSYAFNASNLQSLGTIFGKKCWYLNCYDLCSNTQVCLVRRSI